MSDNIPLYKPKSLLSCIDSDGFIDNFRYHLFLRHRQKCYYSDPEEEDDNANELIIKPRRLNFKQYNRKRSTKKNHINMLASDGTRINLLPKDTPWFKLYVLVPDLNNPRFLKSFRLRFRLPYSEFIKLINFMKTKEQFKSWTNSDACGVESVPIELLLLASLRYLGRGWTFDDLEEATAISRENIRQFFHVFINFGATVLFPMHVQAPQVSDEAITHTIEFGRAGLPGCVGSMDATHVSIEKCTHRLRQIHSGPKHHMPARSFNIVVNHRRLILSSTDGHPARYNDKTLVLFDAFVRDIRDGVILSDVEFNLLERNDANDIVKVRFIGGWVITDNGYLNWSNTIPPFKDTSYVDQEDWSKWIESLSKDVECTFGILKGRWCILKTGIRLHGVKAVDNIWKTCCALHNWLLDVYGLTNEWKNSSGICSSTSSDWEGDIGNHNVDDWDGHSTNRLIYHQKHFPDFQHYDASNANNILFEDAPIVDSETTGYLHNTNNDSDIATLMDDDNNVGPRIVRNLSRDYFRNKLIEHYSIAKECGLIEWPRRNKPSKE